MIPQKLGPDDLKKLRNEMDLDLLKMIEEDCKIKGLDIDTALYSFAYVFWRNKPGWQLKNNELDELIDKVFMGEDKNDN